MSRIVMPPAVERPANHPDKPEQGDDEDFVDYIVRCADLWTKTPPAAPQGFERIPCGAGHWPLYTVADDDFYDGPGCLFCQSADDRREIAKLRCAAGHRRWKAWRIRWKVAGWLYVLGIAGNGGGATFGKCEHCGIGVQYSMPTRYRGPRSYVLGVRTETWRCLSRGHRRREATDFGLCSICCPCPTCGSTDPNHFVDIDCPREKR